MNIINFLRRPRKPATVTKHGLNMAFSVHFDETQYLPLLRGLAPDVLRYPGGTLANYAHVNGNEAGYGLRPDEITNAPGSIHQSMEWQKGERKSAIHEIALVAASLNKPVLWVANIYTGTPEETVQSLGLLIERNVHMAGVEIGNEMYLRRYRYTADQYLREAREHIDYIKHRFPAMPCGVVVAPSAGMKDWDSGDSSKDELAKWNDVVVSSGIGDAYILHAYAPKTGTETHMTALSRHLKTLRKKPVWVTEHGVPGAQQPEDIEVMKQVYDGHMDVFRKDGNVQYACLHNGVGGGDGSNAIQCTGRGCGYTPMGWWVANVPPLDADRSLSGGLRQAAVGGSASFSSCEECLDKNEIIQELGRLLLLHGADPTIVDWVKLQGGVLGDSVLLVALRRHRILKAESIKKVLLDAEQYDQSPPESIQNPPLG